MLVFKQAETHHVSLFCHDVNCVHNVSIAQILIRELKEMKQKINREHFSFCEVSSQKGNQKECRLSLSAFFIHPIHF